MPVHQRRRSMLQVLRYAGAMAHEFRGSLIALALCVLLGGVLHWITPMPSLAGARPSVLLSLLAAWLSMFGEPMFNPPPTWYLALVEGLYPVLGFTLVGEGVVRFGMLMISRRQGEKEWMRVMAKTYRDHVVLCGLGHLGYRILGRLLEDKVEVVAIERTAEARFLGQAKETGIPVLIRDMKEDQALIDAGVPYARAIIIATNDDMANLEVALDARRMNPQIRVIMRMFDQHLADKIKGALGIDAAFSSAALAAPIVASMAHGARVLASFPVAGVRHVIAEVHAEPKSTLCGQRLGELESTLGARVLSRSDASGTSQARPPGAGQIAAGDTITVEIEARHLSALAEAARGGRSVGRVPTA